MVSKSEPDCPPRGWKVQTKVKNGRKYKYYINLKTRKKFYSKLAMLRYTEAGGKSTTKSKHQNEHTKKTSGEKQLQLIQENDCEWLPTGWVVERRLRQSGARVGEEYKCFIDPSTGSKFYSKPEVLRHIRSKKRSAGFSRGKDKKSSVDSPNAGKSNQEAKVSRNSKTSVQKSHTSGKLKVVVEKTVDEDLPSGWIRETRIKMLGNKVLRRYLLYVDPDPASRLIFQSKLDVLRYLETGEISRHAYQRRIGKCTGEALATTKSSSRKEDAAKSRSPKNSGNKRSRTSLKSGSDSQEKIKKKKPQVMKKNTRPAVKNALITKSEPLRVPLRVIFPEKNPLAVVNDCSNNKARSNKRKKEEIPPCAPLRSSKRLAGVDAEVLFLDLPIEHVLRVTNRKPSIPDEKLKVHQDVDRKDLNRRKSSRINPLASLESMPKEVHENHEDVDTKILNEGACDPSRRMSLRTRSLPSLESVPKELHENRKDVDTKILTEGACEAGRRKSSRNKPSSSLESVPKELLQNPKDDDTMISNEGACEASRRKSSRNKPLSSLESVPKELLQNREDVDTKILNEGAWEASRRKSSRTKPSPSLESVELHENREDVDIKILDEGASKVTRRKSSRTKPLPSLESVELHENHKDVDIKILDEGASKVTRRKSSVTKPSPSLESVELHENREDVDKKISDEGASKLTRRKSSRTKPSTSLDSVPKELNENRKDVDTKILNEGACEASRRKSSRTEPPSSLESVPKELHEARKDVDIKILNEGASKASRRKPPRTKPSPSLKSVPKELHENHQNVDTKILNEGVIQTTSRGNSSISKLIPCSNSTPDKSHQIQQGVDEEIVPAIQEEPPFMGINDLNFQEEYHQKIDGGEKIDTMFTSLEKQHQRLDQQDSETVVASSGELFYKIGNFPPQEVQHHVINLNFDAHTVIAIQGEPSTTIGDLKTKRPLLVDLNELQLEAPPGFSGNTDFGASTTTVDQPVDQPMEHPIGTSVGSKVENISKIRSTLEEQSRSEKQIEQPQSELSLWSDPCLEFAYKTLTGAIPLDDTLAIEDYIQHQIRTTEQNTDMYPPGFFGNSESKVVSPLPEDINFLNTNSFGSQDMKQVKK